MEKLVLTAKAQRWDLAHHPNVARRGNRRPRRGHHRPAAGRDHAIAHAEAGRLAPRVRQRFDQIQQPQAEGLGVKAIAWRLGLARGTVRRFARASTVDELLTKAHAGRPSLLDEFKPYLHQRWSEGCINATVLFAEIRQRGYRGTANTLRSYLRPPGHRLAFDGADPAAQRIVVDVQFTGYLTERRVRRADSATASLRNCSVYFVRA